jgi:ADP-ribosylglycohydrolase
VLVGQAYGDALGVHYETGIPSKRNAQMLGGGYGFGPWEWSDDTQQAVIIAQAAQNVARNSARGDAKYIEQAGVGLVRWYQGGPADVGPTAGRTLGQIRVHPNMLDTHPERIRAHLELAAKRTYEDRGRPMGQQSNGSLMRTNPAILPYLGRRAQGAHVVRSIGGLTHADPMAMDAVVLWSLLVEQAIHSGTDFDLAKAAADAVNYLHSRQHEWLRIIGDARTKSPYDFRHNLAVVPAFQAALSTVAHTLELGAGYEFGVQLAIDIGGDTDTIAAIAGGLLGAIYGASAVPGDWDVKLHGWPGLNGAELERLALDAAGLLPKVIP